jgi:hypothetical protein
MGNTYEVHIWCHAEEQGYHWEEIYRGESLLNTVRKIIWAKRNGYKCIKFEYRP